MKKILNTLSPNELALLLAALSTTAAAQWLNYPAAGIPRLPDGKPNLDGIWFVDETPLGEFSERPVVLRSEVKPEDITLTPEREALQRRSKGYDFGAQCLPTNFPGLAAAQPFKIFSNRGAVAEI
jgi:hypothetical protein